MNNLKKLAMLEELKKYDKEVIENKKVLDESKTKIKVNNKLIRKIHKDIYKSILLFVTSTSSLSALTYGAYSINKAIIESTNNSEIDKVVNDVNKNDDLLNVLRLISLLTVMLGADLIIESIFYKVGFNKKDYLGFISSIKSIKEDLKEIEGLSKENKSIKEESKKLLIKTRLLISKYYVVIKKLEEENVLIRAKKWD